MTNQDELRRLLREGPVPAEDEEVAHALRELRYALSTPPPDRVGQEHLAAMTAVAEEAAHEGPPAAVRGRLRRWGRGLAAAGSLKIATAATVAAAATGGGLAATGNLPQPAQERVADVLSHVGISVPTGTDTSDGGQPDERRTPAEPADLDGAPPSSTPPLETPAHGVVGDRIPQDAPADGPAGPADEPVPLEEPPVEQPEQAPSDAGAPHRPASPATEDAPQQPDAQHERPTSADRQGAEPGPPADADPGRRSR